MGPEKVVFSNVCLFCFHKTLAGIGNRVYRRDREDRGDPGLSGTKSSNAPAH